MVINQIKEIDSLKIVWPNKTVQVIENVAVNQTLTISPTDVKPFDYESLQPKLSKMFNRVDDNLGIDFTHKEDRYIDFNRQKLIPYQASDRGPAVAIGDIDNDGKQDIFFGGSKFNTSKIYVQKDSFFVEKRIESIAKDSIKEDISAMIADFNSDGKNDLFVASGGADFYGDKEPLLDSYYIYEDSIFIAENLPDSFENAAFIKTNDYDNDGDLDLFIGNHIVTSDFGKAPTSQLLKNENGKFLNVEKDLVSNLGMLTDAIWMTLTMTALKI